MDKHAGSIINTNRGFQSSVRTGGSPVDAMSRVAFVVSTHESTVTKVDGKIVTTGVLKPPCFKEDCSPIRTPIPITAQTYRNYVTDILETRLEQFFSQAENAVAYLCIEGDSSIYFDYNELLGLAYFVVFVESSVDAFASGATIQGGLIDRVENRMKTLGILGNFQLWAALGDKTRAATAFWANNTQKRAILNSTVHYCYSYYSDKRNTNASHPIADLACAQLGRTLGEPNQTGNKLSMLGMRSSFASGKDGENVPAVTGAEAGRNDLDALGVAYASWVFSNSNAVALNSNVAGAEKTDLLERWIEEYISTVCSVRCATLLTNGAKNNAETYEKVKAIVHDEVTALSDSGVIDSVKFHFPKYSKLSNYRTADGLVVPEAWSAYVTSGVDRVLISGLLQVPVSSL